MIKKIVLILAIGFSFNAVSSQVFSYIERTNSVHLEFGGPGIMSLTFDKTVPISPIVNVSFRGGIGTNLVNVYPVFEPNLLIGNAHHHLDAGYSARLLKDQALSFLHIGYRYIGKNGLTLRASPGYLISKDSNGLWFSISTGYAF